MSTTFVPDTQALFQARGLSPVWGALSLGRQSGEVGDVGNFWISGTFTDDKGQSWPQLWGFAPGPWGLRMSGARPRVNLTSVDLWAVKRA